MQVHLTKSGEDTDRRSVHHCRDWISPSAALAANVAFVNERIAMANRRFDEQQTTSLCVVASHQTWGYLNRNPLSMRCVLAIPRRPIRTQPHLLWHDSQAQIRTISLVLPKEERGNWQAAAGLASFHSKQPSCSHREHEPESNCGPMQFNRHVDFRFLAGQQRAMAGPTCV